MRDWSTRCLKNSSPSTKQFYECLKDNREISSTAEQCVLSADDRFTDLSQARFMIVTKKFYI